MLTIRFQRAGRKNQPAFRIVLAEKQRAAKKKFIELLGHYNPRTKELGIKNPERLQYWIKEHVKVSPTVYNLLITKGFLSGNKAQAWRPKVKKDAAAPAAETAAPAAQQPAKEAAPEVASDKIQTASETPSPAG